MSAAATQRHRLLDQAAQLERSGNVTEAIAAVRTLLRTAPNDRRALTLLARCSLRLNRPAEARQVLAALLRTNPRDSEVWLEWARLHRAGKDWPEAEEALRQVLSMAADHAGAWLETALLAEARGDGDAAADLMALALERFPGNAEILQAAGYFYRRRNQHERAEQVWRRRTTAFPNDALGWIGRGVAFHALDRLADAEVCYRRALQLRPGSPEAHFCLAFTLLAQRRWNEGFEEFRWRLKLPDAHRPPCSLPEFSGREPAGTTVLVWNDQGLGDAIQFLRFVPKLGEAGYRPVVALQSPLVALAATVTGIGQVLDQSAIPSLAGVQCAICDLPRLLGLSRPDRSWSGPYLRAEPRQADLPGGSGRRIGLVWAGAAHHENDRNRSLALSELAPLLEVPDVQWISLQHGPRAADIAGSSWHGRIADMSARLTDMSATAALLAQLDLLVTVDTAVAHLAGALAVPTWLLVPKRRDWRWGADERNSAWYPSLRLWHQTDWNDWRPILSKMAEGVALFRPATP